jgi:hypothetical protein
MHFVKILPHQNKKVPMCCIFCCHNVQTGSGAQLPSQTVGTRVLSKEVKWPGREANHSPPSSTEVKNVWGYIQAYCSVKLSNFSFSYITYCSAHTKMDSLTEMRVLGPLTTYVLLSFTFAPVRSSEIHLRTPREHKQRCWNIVCQLIATHVFQCVLVQ